MRIQSFFVGFALFFVCTFIAGQEAQPPPKAESEMKQELIQKLSGDGMFSSEYIEGIFGDPRLMLDPSVLPRKQGEKEQNNTEAEENYLIKLIAPESVKRGRIFYENNEKVFEEAQKRYGIDPVVIISIFRLETNFGNFRGKRMVLNSLYSIYVLWPKKLTEKMTAKKRKEAGEKWRKKHDWVFKEIQSFLIICSREGWDAHTILGSTAGAFGLPQFEPSSYLQFAVDGDEDGCIDLWNPADAIMSTAHYLHANGWGNYSQQKYRAIHAYNHSKAYVRAVFLYAHALRKSI